MSRARALTTETLSGECARLLGGVGFALALGAVADSGAEASDPDDSRGSPAAALGVGSACSTDEAPGCCRLTSANGLLAGGYSGVGVGIGASDALDLPLPASAPIVAVLESVRRYDRAPDEAPAREALNASPMDARWAMAAVRKEAMGAGGRAVGLASR